MNTTLCARAVTAAFLGLAGLGGTVLAHEGHEHKIMGTITAIDAGRIEVESETDAGTSKTALVINKDTRFRAGKEDAQAADARVGSRVVVTWMEHDGQKIALEIMLPAKPATSSGSQNHEHPNPGDRMGHS